MKIVIAGGSGLIGRALAKALVARGDQVSVLSRQKAAGPPTTIWDASNSGAWQQVLEGAEAIINLAGENIAQGRWTEARKKRIIESRINSTRALVAAHSSAQRRPGVFICASAVGYYGDRGDEVLDESSPPGHDFLANLCEQWEREALVLQALGTRTVCLRIGVVLAREGGALAKMLPIFRLGLGGPLGSGRQWLSWISLDDVVGLIEHAIDREISGPFNATTPHPATSRDFARALGQALHRPAILPVPGFALRLGLGEMAGMLLGGQRVNPKKALESGYAFKHPDLDSALRAELGIC